jgi:hypothetical protein
MAIPGPAKQKIIVGSLLLIYLLVGCYGHQPRLVALTVDPSFARIERAQGTLGLCGIFPIDPQFDCSECQIYDDLLYRTLSAKSRRLVPVSRRQVIESIGNNAYAEIVDEFKTYPASRLKSVAKPMLKNSAFGYLLFGSIDFDDIEESRFEERRPKDDAHAVLDADLNMDLNRDEEETLPEDVFYVFKTTRTIRISFYIYNLDRALLVWRGTFEDSASNRRSISLTEKEGLAKNFVRSLTLGAIEGFYGAALQPDAPEFETLLKRVFISFADQLP